MGLLKRLWQSFKFGYKVGETVDNGIGISDNLAHEAFTTVYPKSKFKIGEGISGSSNYYQDNSKTYDFDGGPTFAPTHPGRLSQHPLHPSSLMMAVFHFSGCASRAIFFSNYVSNLSSLAHQAICFRNRASRLYLLVRQAICFSN